MDDNGHLYIVLELDGLPEAEYMEFYALRAGDVHFRLFGITGSYGMVYRPMPWWARWALRLLDPFKVPSRIVELKAGEFWQRTR